MVEVHLTHVFTENVKKDILARITNCKKGRWVASVALELKDNEKSAIIAEWFYLIVGSQDYFDKPFNNGPRCDVRYTVVQKELDLESVTKIAKERLVSVRAENWEDFYAEMKKHFLYED